MEFVNRDKLRILLTELADAYPAPVAPESLSLHDDPALTKMCSYLSEHGLVTLDAIGGRYLDGYRLSIGQVTVTAKGIDFLQDDGGLTAILGVMTVRLDRESLQALIEARVEASDAPPEKKSAIKSALQSLSAGAWSELAKRLVGSAIDHGPQGADMLQKLLAQF